MLSIMQLMGTKNFYQRMNSQDLIPFQGGGQLRNNDIQNIKKDSILELYKLGNEDEKASWVRVKVEAIARSSTPKEKICTIVYDNMKKETRDLYKLGFRLVRQEESSTFPDSNSGTNVDDDVEESNLRNDGVNATGGKDTKHTTSSKTLKSELKERDMRAQDNGAGGKCFFFCLAAGLGIELSKHMEVRGKVVGHMKSNKSLLDGHFVAGEVEGEPEIKTVEQYLNYAQKVNFLVCPRISLRPLYGRLNLSLYLFIFFRKEVTLERLKL